MKKMDMKDRVRKPVYEGTRMAEGAVVGVGAGIRDGLDDTIGRGKTWALLMGIALIAMVYFGSKHPDPRAAALREVTIAPQAAPILQAAPEPLPVVGGGSELVLRDFDVPYKGEFMAAGQEYDIPWQIIAALAQAESAMNPRAVSSDGYASRGLCQFIPATWTEVTGKWGYSWDDAFVPHKNVRAAAAYLSTLRGQVPRKAGDTEADLVYKILVSYNWGIGNTQKYGADAAPAVTRAYAAKILENAGYLD